MNSVNDAEVPAANPAAALDLGVLQKLLISERGRLLAFVKRHLPACLSPVVEPQDVLHDVYFEAFRRMAQFVPSDDTSVYRWLVTIARNRIAILLRGKRAAKRGGSKSGPFDGSVELMLSELAIHYRTPSRSTAGHEFIRALEQSLNRLPEDLRMAVRLRYLEDLSPAEIAARMDRSVRAVHQLCYRGLRQVRLDLRSASLFM